MTMIYRTGTPLTHRTPSLMNSHQCQAQGEQNDVDQDAHVCGLLPAPLLSAGRRTQNGQ